MPTLTGAAIGEIVNMVRGMPNSVGSSAGMIVQEWLK